MKTAQVLATVMAHYNYKYAGMSEVETYQFVQTYTLKKGLERFKDRGRNAAQKEMRQLHDRVVFKPILWEELTVRERARAME